MHQINVPVAKTFWKQKKKWRINGIKDAAFLYNIVWKILSMESSVDLYFKIDTWRSILLQRLASKCRRYIFLKFLSL